MSTVIGSPLNPMPNSINLTFTIRPCLKIMTGIPLLWWGTLLVSLLQGCSSSDFGASNRDPEQLGNGSTIVSSVHCVGETNLPDEAWTFRTCRFWNLCWKQSDLSSFTLFPTPEEFELQQAFNEFVTTVTDHESSKAGDLMTINSSSLVSIPYVSLQSIYDKRHESSPWFPRHDESSASSVLMMSPTKVTRLPNSVVVVPIVWASDDPSMLWKDYFAIYTVLSMFGFADETDKKVVLLDLKPSPAALPLYLKQWQSELFGDHQVELSGDPESVYCASSAVAGLGRIAATSLNEEQEKEGQRDVFLTHSIFRGIGIFQFREFALRRLGIDTGIEKGNESRNSREAVCFCTGVGERSCKLCSDSERLLLRQNNGYHFTTHGLGDVESLQGLASAVIGSHTLFIDGASHLLLPLATFLHRDATLVVIGTTTEKSFLKTWSHIRVVFIESTRSLVDLDWGRLDRK